MFSEEEWMVCSRMGAHCFMILPRDPEPICPEIYRQESKRKSQRRFGLFHKNGDPLWGRFDFSRYSAKLPYGF